MNAGRGDLVAVDVAAQEKRVSVTELFVEVEIESENVGALSLVCYGGERISLTALVDSLFALAVV